MKPISGSRGCGEWERFLLGADAMLTILTVSVLPAAAAISSAARVWADNGALPEIGMKFATPPPPPHFLLVVTRCKSMTYAILLNTAYHTVMVWYITLTVSFNKLSGGWV